MNSIPAMDQSDHSSSSKHRRTRITRACDTCRRKKIKCDVNTIQPCSPCKQYGWECTFNDMAKKRGPPKGYIESLENRLKKMERLLENIHTDGPEPIETVSAGMKRSHSWASASEQSQEPVISPSTSANMRTLPDKTKEVRYHGSSSGYYLLGNLLNQAGENENNGDGDTSCAVDGKAKDQSASYTGPMGTYRFRRMNKIDEDLIIVRDMTDVENSKQLAIDQRESIDCIPADRPVIEGLINIYFSVPQTTLPIVDKLSFLDAFYERTSPPPTPLLILAICSFACSLIDSSHPIFKNAHVDYDEIEKLLTDSAHKLVKRDVLAPRTPTIQALTILCARPTAPSNSHRSWFLSGLAVRMAQELGLHRAVTTVQLPPDIIENRKRLWYSIYITDRWCCAVLGRPLAVVDSDCDIELPEKLFEGEDYTTFVNFAKLSGILGEVLRRVYSPKAKMHGYETEAMARTVQSLLQMLSEWFDQLPDDIRFDVQDIHRVSQNPARYTNTKKLTEGGPLAVCYHAVKILLLRPFLIHDHHANFELGKDAAQLCNDAAKTSVDIAALLPPSAMIRFGYHFSAYGMVQAILVHIYHCTNTDQTIARTAREYTNKSIELVLKPLSKEVPCGLSLIRLIQHLLQLIRVDPSDQEQQDKAAQSTYSVSVNQGTADTRSSSSTSRSNASETNTMPSTGTLDMSTLSSASYANNIPMNEVTSMASASLNSGIPVTTGLTDGAAVDMSWLLNSFSTASVPQETWQQLFSTTGTPMPGGDSTFLNFHGWEDFMNDTNSSFALF